MLGFPQTRFAPSHTLTPGQQLKRNDELRRLAIARQAPVSVYRAPVPYRTPLMTPYHAPITPYRPAYRAPVPYRAPYGAAAYRYRNDWTREQNERERIRLQALQAQLYQQQTQQQALQQQQSAQMLQTTAPQAAVSPGSPGTDLTPMQDDHAAAAENGTDIAHPHSNHKLLLFGGLIAVAGVGAYVFMGKKKSKSP